PVVQAMRFVAPRIKSIICTHGIDVWEPLGGLRRRALAHPNLVLAPSRDTAHHVASEQRVACERIRVLPWALDPQFEALISAGSHPALPADFPSGRVILAVGRWLTTERYKGMDTLITALPRLLTRWPELQLVLAGTGDDRAWLEDLMEKNGVHRHVHFLTGLSYSELAACYCACEIFALPSQGEGFGLVYLEAMACGKPVIGGAHGGAPEIIEDNVSGYLVPHGDPIHLATCIEALLADPAHAQEETITAERSPFGWWRNENGVQAIYVPTWLRYRRVSWNPAVKRYCRARLQNFDVVHIFGLYDLLGPAVAAASRKRSRPYVLEPIGMFVPIVRNLWLKRMYHALWGRRLLEEASAVIATSGQEAEELGAGGLP